MRDISLELYKKLKNSNMDIALCWKISTKGKCYYYTNYTADLIFEDKKYVSNKIISSSSIEQNNKLDAENYDVSVIFDDSGVSENQIMSGEFDNAQVKVFLLDAQNLESGFLMLNSGNISNIKLVDKKFTFEVVGLANKLNKELSTIYSPTCRAKFGDKKCKLNPEKFVIQTHIEEVKGYNIVKLASGRVSQSNIIGAKLRFLTGRNIDSEFTISDAERGFLTLNEMNLKVIHPLDKVELVPNCDKKFSTCCNTYRNAVNFRGEPNIPGIDQILKTASTYK